MLHWRNILPVLTSAIVLCNAMVCLCGPGATGHSQSQALAVTGEMPSCHGAASHTSESSQDDKQPAHDHGPGCDCHSATAVDAKSAQTTITPNVTPAAFLVALPVWQQASTLGDQTLSLWQGDDTARPFGSSQTLLRLHCALIL